MQALDLSYNFGMDKKMIFNLLRFAAIFGNVLFILWITYNGIDEGFKGTPIQVVSYIGLVSLLSLNIVLLALRKERS
jgi:hypothetical protein